MLQAPKILFLCLCFLGSLSQAFHILIDPGHGGRDRGASVGALDESTVVWPWALSLRRELVRLGLTVTLSRQETSAPPALQRKKMYKDETYDLVISLHANYFIHPQVRGLEYFVRSPLPFEEQKLQLAAQEKDENLVDAIVRDLQQQAQQKQSLQFAAQLQKVWPGKIQQGAFDVLELSAAPSILIELGYLSNVVDRSQLQDTQFITGQSQKMARVIKESLFDQKSRVF